MGPDFADSVVRLLVYIAYIPIGGITAMFIVRWWIDGELSPIPAILCLVGLIVSMVVAIACANIPIITAAIVITNISLLAFFPYARDALEAIEMKAIDAEELEKAHMRLAEKADNIGSVFVIARAVHSLGLHGHAIRIAEAALGSLSTEYLDPIKFQSMRDIFRNEEAQLRKWQNSEPKPKTFAPIKCRACGFTNQAGTIACGRCKGPYLLELARSSFARRRAMARLLAGWGTIAIILPLCGWAGYAVPNFAWIVILVALAAAGIILTLLFRPPQLRAGV